MNPFLQSIFEQRDKPIGESSQKLYARNLFKLNDSKEVTDLNFLKDIHVNRLCHRRLNQVEMYDFE